MIIRRDYRIRNSSMFPTPLTALASGSKEASCRSLDMLDSLRSLLLSLENFGSLQTFWWSLPLLAIAVKWKDLSVEGEGTRCVEEAWKGGKGVGFAEGNFLREDRSVLGGEKRVKPLARTFFSFNRRRIFPKGMGLRNRAQRKPRICIKSFSPFCQQNAVQRA